MRAPIEYESLRDHRDERPWPLRSKLGNVLYAFVLMLILIVVTIVVLRHELPGLNAQ